MHAGFIEMHVTFALIRYFDSVGLRAGYYHPKFVNGKVIVL